MSGFASFITKTLYFVETNLYERETNCLLPERTKYLIQFCRAVNTFFGFFWRAAKSALFYHAWKLSAVEAGMAEFVLALGRGIFRVAV